MHFLTPLFTKSFVGWRFAYSAPPDSLAVLRGPTSKGSGAERKGGQGRGGEGRGEEESVGEEVVLCPSIIRILQTYFRKVDVFWGAV